ncbi:MAG: glycosyltransferase [Acidobacteriaceae bacterium]
MERRPLRCSILGVGDFPEGGAGSQRLYLLARILREGLGDVSLWILHPTAKAPIPENNSVVGEWSGIPFVYLSGATVRPVGSLSLILDTLRGIYHSTRLIARRGRERPDVLVVYTPGLLEFIVPMVVARLARIPIIVEACEVLSASTDIAGAGFLRRVGNSGQSFIEKLTPVMASGLLVISRRIRQYYEQLGLPGDRAYLLPVLIDIERYEKGSDTVVADLIGVKFFLNSGSFNEKDGLVHLVQAMARIHQEHPDVKLVFTGTASGPTQDRILASAGSGGKDWIVFTGLLTRDQLIWCYKNAAGLLCCRSNSDYANYGFPTKLAEYLASGRPVVATSVGDVKDYLTDEITAFLAEPENIESIAMAIRRLLRDPVHATDVGIRGTEVARRYFDYRNHVAGVSTFIRCKAGLAGAD